jgi:hypothetical protein
LRAYEFIVEGNDREYHTGGSLGLPFPGTYEQEYDMFKRKGPRRITAMTNETLDSSYPYETRDGKLYHFETEDGVKYKVYFGGKDLVEVSFSAILPGDEEKFRPDKTTLTGTGNSRKVFGTVVKIVKEFLEEQDPKALYFTGEGSEPSRIRLYDRLISQVDKELPNYRAEKTIDLGSGKAYMLRRREEQVAESVNKTITLADIYDGAYPDDDEVIWNYVGDGDFDIPFTLQTIQPMTLDQILTMQYGVDHIEDLYDKMQPEQIEIIDDYKNDSNLSHQVIVMNQDRIVDGNHRAVAAVLANKPIKYIDISEEV